MARLLEIAASPATDRGLAGGAAAVAAFARSPVIRLPPRRCAAGTVPASRRLAGLTPALAACVTALGAAAAAGALPAPIQEMAHVTFGAPGPHHSVPVPLPTGGSSRQPGNSEIRATGQPGHQKARVKDKKALPDTAQGRQKVHGRKAHPHGQPGHQESIRQATRRRTRTSPMAARRLVTSWRDAASPLPPEVGVLAAQRCQAPAGGAGFVVQAPVLPRPARRAALRGRLHRQASTRRRSRDMRAGQMANEQQENGAKRCRSVTS
jgi:hypothetical protein